MVFLKFEFENFAAFGFVHLGFWCLRLRRAMIYLSEQPGLLGETMHTAGLYYRNNGCFQKITSRLNNRAVDFQTRFDLQKATYLICNSSERKNRYKSATH